MKDVAGVKLKVKLKYPSCTEYNSSKIHKLVILEVNKYLINNIDVYAEATYNVESREYATDGIVPHVISTLLEVNIDWQIETCSNHIAELRVNNIKDFMLSYLKEELGNDDVGVDVSIEDFIDESEFW